jgi:cytochrome c-type biogenesis protein CcmH/NrfF
MGSCQMRPNCGHYDQQAGRLNAFLAEGKDYDEVREAFAAEFGSQAILAAPLDRGFNRLAWLVPYLVALAALIGVVVTARRWSTRAVPAAAGDAGMDATISARLDDELRNLD